MILLRGFVMTANLEELAAISKKYGVIIIVPNGQIGELQPKSEKIDAPKQDYIYAKDLITQEERYYARSTVESDPDNFRIRNAPTYDDKVEPASKEEEDGE
jgi:hypothetical protein